jgi:hypothetical protein
MSVVIVCASSKLFGIIDIKGKFGGEYYKRQGGKALTLPMFCGVPLCDLSVASHIHSKNLLYFNLTYVFVIKVHQKT